jgi:hypothetical protein
MVWPLDEGAAVPLCVRTVGQGAPDKGQVNVRLSFVQRPASPSCVCGEPITSSVQGEEGCEGIERAGGLVGTEACLYVVGGGMGMACVRSQDGAIYCTTRGTMHKGLQLDPLPHPQTAGASCRTAVSTCLSSIAAAVDYRVPRRFNHKGQRGAH